MVGVEPTRDCSHKLLKLACLPISPHPPGTAWGAGQSRALCGSGRLPVPLRGMFLVNFPPTRHY